MTELEPLLKRIEQLTPYFGRAREDLTALTTRARNEDYKGVLQNARLVVEMLLRSLATTELKHTPGKAMLDELISKFRQQAHSGVVPTNILAHMGTVQAWGNLSSHDHAGGLHEAGVKVGLEEAMTSLNSLVAILTWYKARYVQEPAAAAPTAAPVTAASTAAPSKAERPHNNRRLALAAGALLIVLVVGMVGFSFRVAEKTAQLRKQLDTLSAESSEPPAPASCQEQDSSALEALVAVAPRLSDRVPEKARPQEATAALEALRATGQQWRPEGAFYVAKANFLAGHPDTAAMRQALGCEDFAAAENLAGKMAVLAEDWKESEAHYLRAVELDDRFWKPRFNLGILYLQQKRMAEAVPLLERAVELAPADPLIAVHLGHAYSGRAKAAEAAGKKEEALADRDRANTVWCRASQLGSVMGELLCFKK
jgi:tetratricopeptide (TPR) repeat protein